jgi:hypothetical protein
MLELTVSGDATLAGELGRASVLCRAQHARDVRLVLPHRLELNPSLVELLVDFVERSGVRGIELVHTSHLIGFVCSALRMRCPRTQVSSPTEGQIETTRSGRHEIARLVKASSWLVIDAEPEESDRVFLERAFEAARAVQAPRVALGLARAYRLTPDWSQALVQEIRRSPALRELLLVHPGQVAGFVASSVGLECPGVSVSSSSTRPSG